MSLADILTFESPAIHAEFDSGIITITREGKGDHFSFQYGPLVRHGWSPVVGTSLNGAVQLWWKWSDDLAESVDHRGRRSGVKSLAETVEEMAFLYLS